MKSIILFITFLTLNLFICSYCFPTDILNTQQLIKGGNANSFNKNYGKSVIENINNFGSDLLNN